ncbi:MAG: hypothetical protein ABS79_04195 [Planctomycetes bacterium SCN 63-9]|nr:MAG: hypothetical protein ABS79_04195 [Planctomycetes bacterium SCN 63-9]
MRVSRWAIIVGLIAVVPGAWWMLGVVRAEAASTASGKPLVLHARSRIPNPNDPKAFLIKDEVLNWDPARTAIIICDMWNQHWCKGATRRVGEIAPAMNATVAAARAQGVLVIHAPSSCMEPYKDHPARKRAQTAPRAAGTPAEIEAWCHKIPSEEKGTYPVDQNDGGCDDGPQCPQGSPWKSQISTIEIKDEDAISDSGQEIWNLLESRGITNVMLVGVHTNMCVLGRPFGLRNMVRRGKNTVLIRDMTDTMYNSRQWPYVNHIEGTARVVEHIEKFVCPTIASTDLTGDSAFAFEPDSRPRAVFVIGDDEYKTETTLPKFAAQELEPRGIRCTFAIAPEKDKNNFKGAEALADADLLFVSARRRAPTTSQMDAIRKHISLGKPVIGIRTASHAFDTRGKAPAGHAEWTTFDPDVLGGHYTGHHGNGIKPKVTLARGAEAHPILKGVALPIEGQGSLYKTSPLAASARMLLVGEIPDKAPEPVAWVNVTEKGRVFYTSLGHPGDFEIPAFRRMLRNATFWALNRPIPVDDSAKPVDSKTAVQSEGKPKLDGPTAADRAVKNLKTPDDLALDLVLSEPVVRQPVQISFDERGRLWVVQYLQYPFPAGLKMVSRDSVWRAVYDKVPQPPPHHVRGRDKITIHEDTNGDGVFDTHKTFVDGLNIATAVARGRGGVWVLNPPYLLFYADRNNDDVPDGDPIVHLQGFGLEDTHSVVNSLKWGPDGWLYAAQGSTVSGHVRRPGLDDAREPIHSMGQLIWRYHPESRRYEVFAEGGGNAFGVEIDSKGRIFSGHNGGDTRGFHYVQGGYSQKGFGKHGPLSNPYTFGYFPAMKHNKVPRFTHTFSIYEAEALPAEYRGRLFGVAPMLNHVVMSEIHPDGSSIRTQDVGYAIATSDTWFRPVDITLGLDGNLYVADWYDRQVNHYRNHEGQIDPGNGRIYRLRAKDSNTEVSLPRDLASLPPASLVNFLLHPNRAVRQTALRLIGDRKDASLIPTLNLMIASTTGQTSLESLWALYQVGGLDEPTALKTLAHSNPYVRLWTVRLLGDDNRVSPSVSAKLVELAAKELNIEVRSQLACTARRLPTADTLAIVRPLLARSDDVGDIHLPLLLWWAVEAKIANEPERVLDQFRDPAFWDLPIVRSTVAERTMRRFAAAGSRKDLANCAQLLAMAPGPEHVKRLMAGFEAAFTGRSLASVQLPDELAEAIAKYSGQSVPLGLRQGRPEAVGEAIRVLADDHGDKARQLQYLQILGEIRVPNSAGNPVPVLLNLAGHSSDNALRSAALSALARYDDPKIAVEVIRAWGTMQDDVLASAQNLLASRQAWALEFLKAIEAKTIDAKSVPRDVVEKLLLMKDARVASLARAQFGEMTPATSAELHSQIDTMAATIRSGSGVPKPGKQIFESQCAKCHTLFGRGGKVGPDLTTFRRDDLDTMLLSIVNPNAEIREGYSSYLIATEDGRTLTGVLVDQDKNGVVIRGADGKDLALPRSEIAEMKASKTSIMPEGLLRGLDSQQVRDLFAYLRTTQPLID